MDPEQAFREIANNCLAQIRANASHVLEHASTEGVHQMRVGIRRLRCLSQLFGPWRAMPHDLQVELAWLSEVLGAARDADVLAHSTLTSVMQACPSQSDLLPLQQAASAVAATAFTSAAKALRSARYRTLLLGLSAWIVTAPANGIASAQAPGGSTLAGFARRSLQRRLKRLLRCGECLVGGSAEQRHRTRIAAKKVRYATEFFRSLLAESRSRRYVQALSALQESLGSLHDAEVAEALLAQLASGRPELACALAFTCGWLAAQRSHSLLNLAPHWDTVRHQKAPW